VDDPGRIHPENRWALAWSLLGDGNQCDRCQDADRVARSDLDAYRGIRTGDPLGGQGRVSHLQGHAKRSGVGWDPERNPVSGADGDRIC
jgi:hypothetical protein